MGWHHNQTKYLIYVLVDQEQIGAEAIVSYYCQCKNGKRTIGYCVHISWQRFKYPQNRWATSEWSKASLTKIRLYFIFYIYFYFYFYFVYIWFIYLNMITFLNILHTKIQEDMPIKSLCLRVIRNKFQCWSLSFPLIFIFVYWKSYF